mgnify:CR=1 FL=1
MAFSAEVIYAGKLATGVSPSARPPVAGFEWPRRTMPIAFIEVCCPLTYPLACGLPTDLPIDLPTYSQVSEREQAEGDSKYNEAEASRLLQVLAG